MSIPTAHIRRVTIIGDSRIASVIDPHTGKSNSHGLGVCGDPILPYLGHRSEGYFIAFGPVPPAVHHVDTSGRANAKGFYPRRAVNWASLNAPDVPTLNDLVPLLNKKEN